MTANSTYDTITKAAITFSVLSSVVFTVYAGATCEKLLGKVQEIRTERDSLKEKLEFLESYNPAGINIEKMTRGVRNRNPLNIVAMSTRNPWRGQIGKDSENHAIFETFEHGIRAGYLTLRNYYERRGINTLIGITSRFCEGDAEAYAKFIAKNIGVAYNEPINVLDYMPGILKSMVKFENGFDIFPESYYVPYYNH